MEHIVKAIVRELANTPLVIRNLEGVLTIARETLKEANVTGVSRENLEKIVTASVPRTARIIFVTRREVNVLAAKLTLKVTIVNSV